MHSCCWVHVGVRLLFSDTRINSGSSNAIVKLWQTLQLKCFDLLENWKFQWALNFTVVLQCATLATTHFGASRDWLEVGVCVFVCVRARVVCVCVVGARSIL